MVRCLCLAGCRIDVKNDQGVSAEIAALAQGHKDTSDLLKRLKRVRTVFIGYYFKVVSLKCNHLKLVKYNKYNDII